MPNNLDEPLYPIVVARGTMGITLRQHVKTEILKGLASNLTKQEKAALAAGTDDGQELANATVALFDAIVIKLET